MFSFIKKIAQANDEDIKHSYISDNSEKDDSDGKYRTIESKNIELFFDLSFYKKQYPDLIFSSDEEFFSHYVEHGFFEERSPSLLISPGEFKFNNLSLSNWLEKPDYTSLPSEVWKKACFLLKLEPIESNFLIVKQLIKIWELQSLDQAELLFWVIYHSSDLEGALQGCLPNFFDWNMDEYNNDVERFHDWFLDYEISGTSFTSFFDKNYYSSVNSDLGQEVNKFWHFIVHGCNEGRLPSPLINDYQYHQSDSKGLSGIYSSIYDEKAVDYLYEMRHFLERFGEAGTENDFRKLNIILCGNFLDYKSASLFLKIINTNYIKCLDESLSGNGLEVLWNWIKNGGNVAFSPYFCKFDNINDTTNWLEIFKKWCGSDDLLKDTPTDLFDQDFYVKKHLDLIGFDGSLFEHFVSHGQFENRQPHPLFDLSWIGYTYDTNGLSASDYYFLRESQGESIKPAPSIMPLNKNLDKSKDKWIEGGVSGLVKECCGFQKAFDFSSESELMRTIKAASYIDPQIQLFHPSRTYSVMPFNTDIWSDARTLPEVVKKKSVLIFRDAINFGGADVVLKHCYQAWKSTGLSISVVSLGKVDYDVIDSHEIDRSDIIDLSNIKGFQNPAIASHLIYDLIIGTECEYVVNVNCGNLWKTISDYGKIIKCKVKITGLMFCDDRDDFGNIDGYPTRYFMSTIEHLDALYVDSEYLHNVIISRCANSTLIKNKIKVLYTPTENRLLATSYYSDNLADNTQKSIAWAGRFDEQKCPDLLKSIALEMPEVTFYVWGKSVLSRKNYNLEEVDNIKLMGLYKDVNEIAEFGCDLYLYTSLWDGVPTVLLRMQELGLPIVASHVGGVSEAVPSIGLVSGHDPELYIEKIKYFFDNKNYVSDEFDKYKNSVLKTRTQSVFSKNMVGDRA